MMEKNGAEPLKSAEEMDEVLNKICGVQLGVLDIDFMCRTVATLELSDPNTVLEEENVDSVLSKLREVKHGCMLVIDKTGRLKGIFSERDYILKVHGTSEDLKQVPVSKYMTGEPITQPPDATLAHLLSLMSHGGFRHLPIVDQQEVPIWLVSVKDIIDHIMASFTDSLLEFEEDH